jgi:RND superfamily putative drug exporter
VVTRLARIGVHYPRRVLAAWVLCVLAMAPLAANVQDKLLPSSPIIPGTESGDWNELRKPNYDENIAVVLKGPPEAIDAQGPGLARALALRQRTRAISPWSPGAGAAGRLLRPVPDKALIALDVKKAPGENQATMVPPLERFIEEHVKPPITARLVGDGPLGREINEAGFHALETGERIAVPLLIIVLLMVFRSPIAAAIPLAIAGGTLSMGFGLLNLCTNIVDLDIVALSLASMMGLALGVDYSLLLVSRFREELEKGMGTRQAASLAANTAGRTAAFAGCVLVALMTTVLLLSPGSLLFSASIGAIITTSLSMFSAMLVCPAAMTVLGPRVNKWQIGGPAKDSDRMDGFVGRVIKRPLLAAGTVLAGLLLLASPVLAFKTSPPDPRQLPEGTPALIAFNDLRSMGFGPVVEVALRSPTDALTSIDMLQRIRRFEDDIRRVRYVKFVAGPGAIADRTKALRDAPKEIKKAKRNLSNAERELTLRSRQLRDAQRQISVEGRNLDAGLAKGRRLLAAGNDMLGEVEGGLEQFGRLATGLGVAAAGAGQLADGTATLKRNAALLASALRQIRDRVDKLLPRIERGADSVREAQAALSTLRVPAQVTERELQKAFAVLNAMTVGRTDPLFLEALTHTGIALGAASGRNPVTGEFPFAGYRGLDGSLAEASSAASQAGDEVDAAVGQAGQASDVAIQLADGAGRLVDPGLATILSGLRELAKGLRLAHDRVVAARPEIQAQVDRATALFAEGKQFADAAIKDALPKFRQLRDGIDLASTKVTTVRDQLVNRTGPFRMLRELERLEKLSPGFFGSSYLVVAALQGARPVPRRTVENLLDSSTGGDVGKIVIFPDVPTNDPRADQVVNSIRDLTRDFVDDTGVKAKAGGSASELVDFAEVFKWRFPMIIFALCAVTYLFLVPILRSLVLPAIAIALNLVTLLVSFGVLTALFVSDVFTSEPILGGVGKIDIVAATAVFSVVFALSIDYYVFLLTRMREQYVRTQSNEDAIRFGIGKTGRIVTGAAMIMLGTFFAFALTDFVIVKELGVGLTTAIFIDATLVRLALLPATMRLFGDLTWWMPNWLDERLPLFDVEGTSFETETEHIAPRPVTAAG